MKAAEPGTDAYDAYLQKLAEHHAVIVAAMKAKFVLVAMLCVLLQQVGTTGDVWVSKRGLFTVSYESAQQPLDVRIRPWLG